MHAAAQKCHRNGPVCLQVLRKEYRKGVDVVYESVGGGMFKVAVDALAQRGRLLVIGMMSQYGKGWPLDDHPGLPEKLLKKSASLIGASRPLAEPVTALNGVVSVSWQVNIESDAGK